MSCRQRIRSYISICIACLVICRKQDLSVICVSQAGADFQIVRTCRDASVHEHLHILDCDCCCFVRFCLNCEVYFTVFRLSSLQFDIGFAVDFECRIAFECEEVLFTVFNLKSECSFVLCPQAFFSLCDCNSRRDICVSVVDDDVVLFSLNFVRFYELRDCNFLIVNQFACQLQDNIALKTRVSNQLQLECHGSYVFAQNCINVVEYSLLELKVYMAAILICIKECLEYFVIISFSGVIFCPVVAGVCYEESICVDNLNICYIYAFRQFEVEAFSEGPCAGECFLSCYFHGPVIAVVCDTIVVSVYAAVDYGHIFVFVNGKFYLVINNLHDFNCCSCIEQFVFVGVCGCYKIFAIPVLVPCFYCQCADSAGLSGCSFNLKIVLVDCDFIACACVLHINCVAVNVNQSVVRTTVCLCLVCEFEALGKLQFKPLVLYEIVNNGFYNDVAVQCYIFFFSNCCCLSCCSCDASAFDRNINQIVRVYKVASNGNFSIFALFVLFGDKVDGNDIAYFKVTTKSNFNFIAIFQFDFFDVNSI